jgi:soluble lytic murein transglycosylase-like protein
MIPLGIIPPRREGRVQHSGFENISMRFCFILLIAGLAQAADPPRPVRQITSVVKADPRTGRLVRSVIVSPKTVGEKQVGEKQVAPAVIAPRAVPATAPADSADSKAPSGIDEAVEQIAARHGLTPALLHSVIKVESNYNPYAVSPKGAQGLMQLIPETARRFGVANPFNPLENIEGGARYLRYLIDLYGENNGPLVLAAYNAGEAAVAKYGGVPPYRETQNYLVLVKKQLDKARPTVAPPPPAPKPAATEVGPAHIVEIVETDGTVRYVSR